MAEDWSHREVTATVEAYFDMLEAELAGIPYNKTEVRRLVLPRLEGRSKGALEFKNCNVSAALNAMGLPSIDGYKPRWKYQKSIHNVIEEVLARRPRVFGVVEEAVEKVVTRPVLQDILSIYDTELPERGEIYGSSVAETYNDISHDEPNLIQRNFLEIESKNRSVGLAGEQLVLEYERARLLAVGRDNLADRIEHTSLEKGDGAGFDIRSFDENGNDLFIEVKSTQFRKETPFFISANEVKFSERYSTAFSLYRVYSLTKKPRLFSLPGEVSKNCNLSATNFRATF